MYERRGHLQLRKKRSLSKQAPQSRTCWRTASSSCSPPGQACRLAFRAACTLTTEAWVGLNGSELELISRALKLFFDVSDTVQGPFLHVIMWPWITVLGQKGCRVSGVAYWFVCVHTLSQGCWKLRRSPWPFVCLRQGSNYSVPTSSTQRESITHLSDPLQCFSSPSF